MPMHDYRCGGCGAVFEALVRLGAPAPACRACGAPETERCVAAPAAPPRLPGVAASARRQAAREGHFSHYQRSERPH